MFLSYFTKTEIFFEKHVLLLKCLVSQVVSIRKMKKLILCQNNKIALKIVNYFFKYFLKTEDFLKKTFLFLKHSVSKVVI